jgi:hypothetical protein
MKAYVGLDVRMYVFLTYALNRGELPTLFPLKDPPVLDELRRWSHCFRVEKNLLLLREIKLRFLARPSHSL